MRQLFTKAFANNYIINEDGDWIDATGQLLDKAEAAARDAHFEKHPNDPVIARGCTVRLTGKGKHQAEPKVTPKGCFYLWLTTGQLELPQLRIEIQPLPDDARGRR